MFEYISPRTQLRYRLYTELVNYSTAAAACQSSGGFLTTFWEPADQVETETYFLKPTMLNPIYYWRYWIGLSTPSWNPNTFAWQDGFTPGPSRLKGDYLNWGTYVDFWNPAITAVEPDNQFNPELCGTADYREMKTVIVGNSTAQAFGWADNNCTASWPYVCKYLPPPIVMTYYSPTFNKTYVLNTTRMNNNDAEQFCRDNGGHMASWSSAAEQNEVEEYFTAPYKLLLPYMPQYWIGLRSKGGWSARGFQWLDQSLPAPGLNASVYSNWGIKKQAGKPDVQEPDNMFGSETCAVANWTQVVTSPLKVWGWSDTLCTGRYPVICTVQREWRFSWLCGAAMARLGAGCRLLMATGCCWLLLATRCCWLLAAAGCCWLLAAAGCCWLLAAAGCCWLLLAAAGCCWLLAAL
jgi:hypothetical protein